MRDPDKSLPLLMSDVKEADFAQKQSLNNSLIKNVHTYLMIQQENFEKSRQLIHFTIRINSFYVLN